MLKSETLHISVLLHELVWSIDVFEARQNIIVDCTLWSGWHAREVLKRLHTGDIFIGFDADVQNLALAEENLKDVWSGVQKIFIHSNYVHLKETLYEYDIFKITGIYYDLWISSMQIDEANRGFSFMQEGPLDMRFDSSSGISAANIVNQYDEKKLTQIFSEYGEEPKSHLIAKKIIEQRKTKKLTTTKELADIIEAVDFYPVTKARIFQALRIEVNNELWNLEDSLGQAIELLEKDGKIFVISFHSIEDRIVKQLFKRESLDCICENTSVPCNCKHKKQITVLTKKPILPTENEVQLNKRSRSAKGRSALKL